MQDQNVFAGAFVDRAGERRKDPEWLADAVNAEKSLFLPVWGDRCLVNTETPACCLLPFADVRDLIELDELIFLGLFRDRPVFAFAVPREEPPPFPELGDYKDLRTIGTELSPDEANLAAHARALVLWHQSQLYCGRCGGKASSHAAGNARRCSSCDNTLFPRVDPAVIVLVSRGDRCLLGRQASWPEGRYSTIAGFVEPGESLEDGVRREVFEETNILVGEVRYHSSQPWPFPSSLMLGFHAEGLSDDIVLNDAELEDARWFTREELHSEFPKLPFRISIARRLVDAWLFDGS
ncbi:MAG: NAD(+) diphosphatase [Pseudomonadota bacterium]